MDILNLCLVLCCLFMDILCIFTIYHHGYLLCSLLLYKTNEKGGNMSFHRFLHNKPDLLEKWVQAVRQNWYPNKNSLICSVHFTESCFTVTPGNQCHQLHKNAMPSVFHSFQNTCKKLNKKEILL